MIPGVAAAFHTRDDEWILRRKLEVLTQFCERIYVVLDRPSDATYEILEEVAAYYPNLYWELHVNKMGLPDEGPDGPICEEGVMRQRAWDLASSHEPKWIVLGDTDEIPGPGIVSFIKGGMADPKVDVYYAHWMNLWQSPWWYISGEHCIWSPDHKHSTKKGVLCRWRPEVEYRYDLSKTRHTRLEPNPVDQSATVFDETHVLQDWFPLVHWKWVNWLKWRSSKQSKMEKYIEYFRGMTLRPTPHSARWKHNAL